MMLTLPSLARSATAAGASASAAAAPSRAVLGVMSLSLVGCRGARVCARVAILRAAAVWAQGPAGQRGAAGLRSASADPEAAIRADADADPVGAVRARAVIAA